MRKRTLKRSGRRPVGIALALMATAFVAGCVPRYDPTPANEATKAELVDGALTFVLLHEAGHMMLKLFNLPKVGSEEDLADHFASAVLTGAMGSDPGGRREKVALVSAAFYFDQEHQARLWALQPAAWSDEHGEPEQRAYNIICMLYGSSPNEFGQMARVSKLPPQRLESCPDEAGRNQRGWQKLMRDAVQESKADDLLAVTPTTVGGMILQEALRETTIPEDHKVGVFFNQVPSTLSPAVKARLEKAREAAQQGHAIPLVMGVMKLAPNPLKRRDRQHPDTDYAYRLVGDACIRRDGTPDDNAWWDASTATITYCYELVAKIQDRAQAEVAIAGKQMQKTIGPAV